MGEEMEIGCTLPTGGPVGEINESASNGIEWDAIGPKEVTAWSSSKVVDTPNSHDI
jgi:hypothetical protein